MNLSKKCSHIQYLQLGKALQEKQEGTLRTALTLDYSLYFAIYKLPELGMVTQTLLRSNF